MNSIEIDVELRGKTFFPALKTLVDATNDSLDVAPFFFTRRGTEELSNDFMRND